MSRLQPVNQNALVARDGDVYIAGQPTPADLDAWKARGVGTVVNLRSRAETAALPFDMAAEAGKRGLRYVEIPMGGTDGHSPAVTIALADVLESAAGAVAVHCRSGGRVAHAYAAHLLAGGQAEPGDLADFGWPGGLDLNVLAALAPE